MTRGRYPLSRLRLEEALEMTSQEQTLMLSTLRMAAPGIADELSLLLRDHRELSESRFLEQRSFRLPGEPCIAGQRIGPYTAVSEIGHGGMSTVWLAVHDHPAQQQVAVKFLRSDYAGLRVAQQLRHEAGILAKVVHPFVAQLLETGVTAAGTPFLLLEYVDGQHIDDYCDHGRLGLEPRIRLFLNVLSAVSHVHQKEVVHCDLKPSNILVRSDGCVKLLDFGAARLLSEDAGIRSRSGMQLLTPGFAAPEQLSGDTITPATDVYALGVMLYDLLTGKHPFAGESRPHAGSAAIHRADLPQLHPALDGDLTAIVQNALQKEPSHRYSSADAFAGDLRGWLGNEPNLPPCPTPA